MGGELERRWDDAVEGAWREFRQRLADHVAGMGEDDSLVVEVPPQQETGAAPYCQVAGGEAMVRVEAVSNVYLAAGSELDEEQERALEGIGFRRPEAEDWPEGETNFWLDLELREADRAAVMVVRALREVYGVLHPVYLDADGLDLDLVDVQPKGQGGTADLVVGQAAVNGDVLNHVAEELGERGRVGHHPGAQALGHDRP